MTDTQPLIHEFITPQRRGLIALNGRLRERLRLDDPGAQLEFIEREDGVIEVRGVLPVPADQQWFWSERWQKMEREADADIEAGRTSSFESVDDFLADLDS